MFIIDACGIYCKWVLKEKNPYICSVFFAQNQYNTMLRKNIICKCEVPKMSGVCIILFSVLHTSGYCFTAKSLGICQKCYKMPFLGGASRETESMTEASW